jgi:hypothetical protein
VVNCAVNNLRTTAILSRAILQIRPFDSIRRTDRLQLSQVPQIASSFFREIPSARWFIPGGFEFKRQPAIRFWKSFSSGLRRAAIPVVNSCSISSHLPSLNGVRPKRLGVPPAWIQG